MDVHVVLYCSTDVTIFKRLGISNARPYFCSEETLFRVENDVMSHLAGNARGSRQLSPDEAPLAARVDDWEFPGVNSHRSTSMYSLTIVINPPAYCIM